jgi:hypothetical protein
VSLLVHGLPNDLQLSGLACTPLDVSPADAAHVLAGASGLSYNVGLPDATSSDGLSDGLEQVGVAWGPAADRTGNWFASRGEFSAVRAHDREAAINHITTEETR